MIEENQERGRGRNIPFSPTVADAKDVRDKLTSLLTTLNESCEILDPTRNNPETKRASVSCDVIGKSKQVLNIEGGLGVIRVDGIKDELANKRCDVVGSRSDSGLESVEVLEVNTRRIAEFNDSNAALGVGYLVRRYVVHLANGLRDDSIVDGGRLGDGGGCTTIAMARLSEISEGGNGLDDVLKIIRDHGLIEAANDVLGHLRMRELEIANREESLSLSHCSSKTSEVTVELAIHRGRLEETGSLELVREGWGSVSHHLKTGQPASIVLREGVGEFIEQQIFQLRDSLLVLAEENDDGDRFVSRSARDDTPERIWLKIL